MYRLSTVGMNVSTWQKLMDLESSRHIENFGDRIRNVSIKERILGENMSSFIDQNLISARIHKWLKIHGENKLSEPNKENKFDQRTFLEENYDKNKPNWFERNEANLPKGKASFYHLKILFLFLCLSDGISRGVLDLCEAIGHEWFKVTSYINTFLKIYSQCENPNSVDC